jgi:hypothetical protein
MKYAAYLILITILLAIFLGGCGKDAIVGSWTDSSRDGPVVYEFHDNHTGMITVDQEKMVQALQRFSNDPLELIRKKAERFVEDSRSTIVTWKKTGAFYCVTLTKSGDTLGSAHYYKIEHDHLLALNQDGTPNADAVNFTRAK